VRFAAVAAAWMSVAAALAWPSFWTTVDDAWISARYADHLVRGFGLTYSVDQPPVEGFTNLGWVLLLAAGLRADLPPDVLLPGLGLVCGLSVVPLAMALARVLGAQPHGVAVAGGLVALDVHHAIASTNGLETAMYAALVMAGLWAMVAQRHGWVAGLPSTVRPEGVWVALAAAARAPSWRAAAWPLCAPAAVSAWRAWTYGTLVPNTFTAKSLDPWSARLAETVRLQGPDLAWWLPVAVLLAVASLRGSTTERRAVARTALLLGASTLTVAEWMPAGRLWVPAGNAALVLVAVSLQRPGWALVAPLAVLVLPLHAHLRAYDRNHSVLPDNAVARAVRHVAAAVPAGQTLVVRDAGVAAFWWGAGNPVRETHEDALTVRHSGGARADPLTLLTVPPALVVATVARPDAETSPYRNDQRVLQRFGPSLLALGRVAQHHRRYYDLYVAAELGVPPLPDGIAAGPAPPPVATRHGPSPPNGPAPRRE
jgi:hypothetical protein